MYTPQAFAVTDSRALLDFVAHFPFATLISQTPAGPQASHVPLVVEDRAAQPLVLLGHLARANPHWRSFDGETPALAIFHGPHAYVSPAWYATSPAVPTWNYAAVHASGAPRRIETEGRAAAILDRLVATFESVRREPWSGVLPDDFRRRMHAGITAFELPVTRMEGKFKLGQNRSEADQRGTLAGLESEGGPGGAELAAFVRKWTFSES